MNTATQVPQGPQGPHDSSGTPAPPERFRYGFLKGNPQLTKNGELKHLLTIEGQSRIAVSIDARGVGSVEEIPGYLDSLRARERAVKAGRDACKRYDLQFLDDTVSFTRLRLARDEEGQLRIARTYTLPAKSHQRVQALVDDQSGTIRAQRGGRYQISGLLELFSIHDTVEAAIAGLPR